MNQRGGGHVRESSAIARGKVPLGLKDGASVAESQRFIPFSQAQRDEIEEIFRGCMIEAWMASGAGSVPSSLSIWGHAKARVMGHVSNVSICEDSARVWREARAEGSRRAARYLYGESETGAPSVSLDWLADEGRRAVELSTLNDAIGDGAAASAMARGDSFLASYGRAIGAAGVSGEFRDFQAVGEAMEQAGDVVASTWDSGAARRAVIRCAWDMAESHARGFRSEVRGFLGEVRAIHSGVISMPLDWLTCPEAGKSSGIVAKVRQAANRNGARIGGAALWDRARRAVELRWGWAEQDTARAIGERWQVVAARARASSAYRALLRLNADTGSAYAGGSVSVSFGRALVGVNDETARPWSRQWYSYRALSVSITRGASHARPCQAARGACDTFAARIAARQAGTVVARAARPQVARRGVDWDLLFSLGRQVARTREAGTGRAAFSALDCWQIASDRRASEAMRAIHAKQSQVRRSAMAATLAARGPVEYFAKR